MKLALFVALTIATSALGASKDLGNGFTDHGVAAPISNHRGTVATVDGNGRNVVIAWLMQHSGVYELLLLDAQTGKAEEFPIPFKLSQFDAPYGSILSSGNKFYTHIDSHFIEFDVTKRAFTLCEKTVDQMCMSMTEDDNGVIWSVSYPQSGVCSFDPKTRTFKDYGHLYKQNWAQYPSYCATDDAGFVYFGIGRTLTQVVIFDPKTAKATPVFEESQRRKGTGYVYRDTNGKVYGQVNRDDKEDWYEFYKGVARKVDKPEKLNPKKYIAGAANLFHQDFPDGSRIETCDMTERKLVIINKDKNTKEFSFDYSSDGAHVMGFAAAPDGTIYGATAFPMRFVRYDPKTDTLDNRACYMQWNTLATLKDRFYVGGYPWGYILEYDPSKPYIKAEKIAENGNPAVLVENSDDDVHRPSALLAYPDGKTIIMGGTPQYGFTGGGLVIYNRETKQKLQLSDKQIIPDQSTMSLLALPDNQILAGTTTAPGTGGEKKAAEARLYIMNLATQKIDWQDAPIKGVQEYTALRPGPNGLIYGVADKQTLFVFDPAKRAVISKHSLPAGTVSQQGPRPFASTPDGQTYLILKAGIARIDPATHEVKLIGKSPTEIDGGGDYLDGRIYFSTGSHLGSFKLP